MEYSKETQELIDRQCRNVERSDFTLDKKLSEKLIMKTYDLFKLDRPKKVKWCVDLSDKDFQRSAGLARSAWSAGLARSAGLAWSAGSARSAGSAWSARLAWSDGSAGSAWSDGLARSARSAWSAGSAWSDGLAWSAGSARSAGSAGSDGLAWSAGSARSDGLAWPARSALDYDFDYYVFEYEYCKNPDKGLLPNENDYRYLEYCELLMQAKEAGLGYRIEFEDTLYLVPTPIVRINNLNQFHSDTIPAIRWKEGQEFFFLNGVRFEKDLWTKVVSRKMPMSEIMAIADVDQRTQAMKYGDFHEFAKIQNAKCLDKHTKSNINGEDVKYELWEFPKGDLFVKDVHFMWYTCPSTKNEYVSGVWESKTVKEAMARKQGITEEMWLRQVPLLHES